MVVYKVFSTRPNFLLVAPCSLLFARCSLVFACYFSLITRYFSLVVRYYLLVARYFLLVARYFLLVARYFSIQITVKQSYCEPQKNSLTITKLRHRYFLANFWDFGNFFWMVVFSTCKTIFKVDIKSQILPELISLWCLYYNIWTRLNLQLCTWRVRSSHPEKLWKRSS